jgi:hypothetical protein
MPLREDIWSLVGEMVPPPRCTGTTGTEFCPQAGRPGFHYNSINWSEKCQK